MTGSRLLSKLLRFKGFRVVSWWFEGRSCFVIAVTSWSLSMNSAT